MGDAMLGQRVEDRARPHPAQADMGARHHRQRPGKAPAVAVEHRQGPQQTGMLDHVAGQRHCHSPSGRRRDGDRPRPWDCRWCRRCSSARWRPIRRRGIARRNPDRRSSGSPRSRSCPAARRLAEIPDRHNRSPAASSCSSASASLTVAENSRSVIRIFALAMLQHEGDGRGIEPGVERVQHRAQPSARRNGLPAWAGCWPASPPPCRPADAARFASAEASRRQRA